MPLLVPGRAFSPVTKRASRLQFSWDARDLSLVARTGQVGQFARTSVGFAIDSLGRYRKCVHSQPRWHWVDRDGDGFRETVVLLLEAAAANLITGTGADDLSPSGGWSATGVSAATGGWGPFAGFKFCRIQGTNNTTQISRAVTFTGDGVKSFSLLARAQPGVAGKDAFVIHDNPSNADRLVVTLTIAADGTMTATAGTGQTVKLERLADGVYRLLMTTTAITASHAHTLWVSDIGGTGLSSGQGVTDRYYTCAQPEDAVFPSSPMPAAHLTRAADLLRFPFNAAPQLVAMYSAVIDLFPGASLHRLASLSTAAASAFDLYRQPSTTAAEWGGVDSNGAATVAMVDPAYGDFLEAAGSWNANGQTAPLSAPVKVESAINGGAIATATNAAGSRLPASWTDPFVYFNGYGGPSYGMASVRIGNALRSLTEFRGVV